MKNLMRLRFWLEVGTATITGVLFVITLLWDEWFEMLFGVSPDGGDGSWERWLVGALLVATISLITLARLEWRRARTSPA